MKIIILFLFIILFNFPSYSMPRTDAAIWPKNWTSVPLKTGFAEVATPALNKKTYVSLVRIKLDPKIHSEKTFRDQFKNIKNALPGSFKETSVSINNKSFLQIQYQIQKGSIVHKHMAFINKNSTEFIQYSAPINEFANYLPDVERFVGQF